MTMTKSEACAADVSALLRARNSLIWIVTREEARVERYLVEAAAQAKYIPRTWDVAQGVTDIAGVIQAFGGNDPGDTLAAIRDRSKAKLDRGVWIMRDLHEWLQGPAGAATKRMVRNLARQLADAPREGAQAIVVLSPSRDIPPELAGHAVVLDWPLPDRGEIADILDVALEPYTDEQVEKPDNGTRDAAIDAAVGLSSDEAQSCYAKSIVLLGRVDPALIASEKKRIVARDGLLEWFDPLPEGLDSVGGLDLLKTWLNARRSAYSKRARDYGLPAPKGAVLVGVPGCGKSLTAKAVATGWSVPLLRFDLGALRSKFVGESEANIRKAFATIEALGRCVVWIDEIEKALQGATSGSADGGVSADALGAILNWMQERRGEAFVIATANDVEGLPPEVLRKGRFDEVWFVDLPTGVERQAIVQAALRSHGRGKVEVDLAAIADECEGYTGAEIAALVPEALFAAFADKEREITTADLVICARTVVPLSKTAAEKIARLRQWASGRARLATTAETTKTARRQGRALDIEA